MGMQMLSLIEILADGDQTTDTGTTTILRTEHKVLLMVAASSEASRKAVLLKEEYVCA